jgi:hypothetical protein
MELIRMVHGINSDGSWNLDLILAINFDLILFV